MATFGQHKEKIRPLFIPHLVTLIGMQVNHCHRQLVVSIPRLSARSYHLLGKINTMGIIFSM